MVLLQNNKLVQLDTREDSFSTIIAVKSLEVLKEDNTTTFHVKSVEYTLTIIKKYDENKQYLFVMTKSPFKDDSGIGNGYKSTYFTKGNAILDMINDGFRVYQNGIEILPLED